MNTSVHSVVFYGDDTQTFGKYLKCFKPCVELWCLLSDKCVLWSFYGIVHSKSSWVVQTKAGVNIISEVTLEGVQMLFQIHVKEGQSPSVIV